MSQITGRKKEIKRLKGLAVSNKSEFIAVFGRRRVGKTFLIKEFFKGQYSFQMTGTSSANLEKQLGNFFDALKRFFPLENFQEVPNSWIDAFQLLRDQLEKSSEGRKIIFIDELPWLDTPKSEFVPALEHFWNSWAFHRNDVLLIVCGSATSWMINELINHHGGLHNRVTARIHLQPFTLGETEAFLKSRGAVYERYEIVQLYMTMGGIPYYLDTLDTGKSIPQNVDDLFFKPGGELQDEFRNLYRSLFKNEQRHVSVIESLAQKSGGMTRDELSKASGISNGGTFSLILEELEQCGFLKKFTPFGKKFRGSLYQLIDPYSLFYLKFVKNSKALGAGAWSSRSDHPSWRAWSGYAFENICFSHIDQIKNALGIRAVYTETSSWRSQKSIKGSQIDLVVDRRDRTINLCEIKFSETPYSISKAYAENLRHKIKSFKAESQTRKTLFLTFISPFGLKQNQYSGTIVQNDLTLDALFD